MKTSGSVTLGGLNPTSFVSDGRNPSSSNVGAGVLTQPLLVVDVPNTSLLLQRQQLHLHLTQGYDTPRWRSSLPTRDSPDLRQNGAYLLIQSED
jgi:hypothetical protein